MLTLKNNIFQTSFFRFLCVGVVNTMVGYGLTVILFNLFKVPYWPSTFVANIVGATVSYFLNKRFTFKSNSNAAKSIPRFIIVILCCYFGAYYFADVIARNAVPMFIANADKNLIGNMSILIGMGLYTISNYLGQKFFAFK